MARNLLRMAAVTTLAIALTSVAAAQDTSGTQSNRQPNQSVAQPSNPSPSENTGNDVTRETTWGSSPVNTNSYMSPASPAAPMSATSEEQQKRDAAARQYDPNKSPWWEPRDWSYINNEAP